MAPRVLVVDDDADLLCTLSDALEDAGYETIACSSATDALRVLDAEDIDVVLSDLRMPVLDGIGLCERIGRNSKIPVILMTAYSGMSAAVDAMRAEAFDFLVKPFPLTDLCASVARATERRATIPPAVRKLDDVPRAFDAPNLVGASSKMRELMQYVSFVSASNASVLITGESGTGKELVARALHENGLRRSGPFVAVSCAAVPAQILESELFGHVKGAFTGAAESRRGIFLDANGGTLLLDEIGAMPVELQPALLRALQERAVRPVGGTREEPFDARVLAATNSSLRHAVSQGTFRDDLLFRLEVLNVHIPPLRERGEDIRELAEHFLGSARERLGRPRLAFSDDALAAILRYSWPGNVRELENCIEGAAALAHDDVIAAHELPKVVQEPGRPTNGRRPSLDHLRHQHIERVLRAVNGNVAKAARVLGMDRGTLYRRVKRPGSMRPTR
ncbi:MAG TPA: sigma-54 dependent transcriptional regulator [Polyangiaceae bacterium]|jgi:two-component system response regulator HydG|nr:sigma-54 dependent transcriptional regulator [Polyangiaceae bacterium]